MKKETVTKLLDKLEREAKKEKDMILQRSLVHAINQCRAFLNLTWADMLAPVRKMLETITTEIKPLLEKEQQQTLSEEDALRLQRARAISQVYAQFRQKIYPTASRASTERHVHTLEKERAKGNGQR
jgi:hypothetical protein